MKTFRSWIKISSVAIFLFLLAGIGTFFFMEQRERQEQLKAWADQSRAFLHNPDFVKRVVPGIALGDSLNSSIIDCVDGKGFQCQKYENKEHKFLDPEVFKFSGQNSDGSNCALGPKCEIWRESSFTVSCPTENSCTDIVLKFSIHSRIWNVFEISENAKRDFLGSLALEIAREETRKTKERLGLKPGENLSKALAKQFGIGRSRGPQKPFVPPDPNFLRAMQEAQKKSNPEKK